jgi:hypothetical protein
LRWSHYVAQTGLEFNILLLFSEHWDYRHDPPHPSIFKKQKNRKLLNWAVEEQKRNLKKHNFSQREKSFLRVNV